MVTKRRKNRLRQSKQEALLKYFVNGLTARTAALYFHKLRQVIAAHLETEAAGLFLDDKVGIADTRERANR